MRRPSIHLALLALTACGSSPGKDGPDFSTPTLCGGPTCLEVTDDGLKLLHAGELRLTLPQHAIQVGVEPAVDPTRSYDPLFPDAATDWQDVVSMVVTRESADAMSLALTYDDATVTLDLTAAGDGRIAGRLHSPVVSEGVVVAWRLKPEIDVSEGFYGLGETFDRPEHRGTIRPMHMGLDAELESATSEVHVPVPLLIGTTGWGLFVAEDHPTVFDVAASQDDRVVVTTGKAEDGDQGLAFHLYTADTALDVTALYYATTGYPALPAPWATGPLLWRDENTGQQQVIDDIERLRELDLAVSGIWIDRPYATGVNTFDFKPDNWPDPAEMVVRAHAAGLRVGVWHTPYLSDETATDLHDAARSAGYFPPTVPIFFNQWSEPLDLTQPPAVAWWQDQLSAYTDLGLEGYKLDYGEDVVVGINGVRMGWEFADGSDERTMHKEYTRLYHQTYADTLPADGGFLLCRAGTWGDQTVASIIWPGDLDADLSKHRDPREDGSLAVGGLPAAVSAAAGLGPSGFPFFGSDTGGYRHSPPSVETFVRWFQHTAFTAVMQVGNSASPQPWELLEDEPELLDHYRELSRLHLRLFPTTWTLAQDLAHGGRPILRPFGLQQPQHGVHPADAYFFGEDLLVAPVVETLATTRTLPCPAGEWVGFFDGAELDCQPGSETTVPAPLEVVPVFLRVGGVVPLLRPDIDTLAPVEDGSDLESYAQDPGRLWARMAAGASGETVLWDGSAVVLDDDGANIEVLFTEGDVFHQGAAVEVVGLTAAPSVVTVDGVESDDWSWTDGMLVAEFENTLTVER